MAELPGVVFVIDDDPSMRAALEDLITSVRLDVRLFASPQEFLHSNPQDVLGCLVLDVRLPGMSGLTFQKELAKAGIALPVIFITGHGDIPMSVRAMKAGAVEFLTKPFHEQDLLDAIYAGIERDRARRRGALIAAELRERYAALTERERQIMAIFAATPGETVPRDKLVTGSGPSGERTVDVQINRLRRKVEADPVNPVYLQTVRGIGYRLAIAV